MPFAWIRTPEGLVYVQDTTPDGVGKATSKIDADSNNPGQPVAAVTAEATYETDRTSLTGADPALQVNDTPAQEPLTVANPGV